MSNRKATYRLPARVPSELYDLVREAAAVKGLPLTDNLLVTLRKSAEATLERHHAIQLSSADQAAFAKALLEPQPLSDALNRALTRRRELLGH